jgi:hypothetical protein
VGSNPTLVNISFARYVHTAANLRKWWIGAKINFLQFWTLGLMGFFVRGIRPESWDLGGICTWIIGREYAYSWVSVQLWMHKPAYSATTRLSLLEHSVACKLLAATCHIYLILAFEQHEITAMDRYQQLRSINIQF